MAEDKTASLFAALHDISDAQARKSPPELWPTPRRTQDAAEGHQRGLWRSLLGTEPLEDPKKLIVNSEKPFRNTATNLIAGCWRLLDLSAIRSPNEWNTAWQTVVVSGRCAAPDQRAGPMATKTKK